MDFLYRLDNPTAQGDGTATVIIPTNLGVKDLILKVVSGTVTADMFENLQVQINGKPTIDIDGATLNAMNQVDKLQAMSVDGLLRINLGLLGELDPRMRDLTNIVTGIPNKITGKVAKTLQLKYKLAGATNPQIEAFGQVYDPGDGGSGPGMVKYLVQHQFDVGVNDTGFTLPNQYGDDQYAMVRRIWFQASGGNLVRARLIANKNDTVYDADVDIQKRLQKDSGSFDPDAASNFFSLIAQFPPDGQSGSIQDNGLADDLPFLDLRRYKKKESDNTTFRVVAAADAPVTVTMTMEVMGTIPN